MLARICDRSQTADHAVPGVVEFADRPKARILVLDGEKYFEEFLASVSSRNRTLRERKRFAPVARQRAARGPG
jgi:hypothetical protein